jgi:NDP-sugar pyrophosphorylase family protein
MDTAVVLAAGRGTRMGSLTASTPKPLLEVADRSLIAHVAAGIADAGLRRMGSSPVSRREDQAALGNGSEMGIEIGTSARRARTAPRAAARQTLDRRSSLLLC